MSWLIFTIRYVLLSVVRMMEILLFIRAILSWFPQLGKNALTSFLYYTTEPFLSPIRTMLRKIEALRSLPIDFSVLVGILILELLRGLLL